MTIDQFMSEMQAAVAGLPSDAEVEFKVLSAKAEGSVFGAIATISQVGKVARVYPGADVSTPARVVVEFS